MTDSDFCTCNDYEYTFCEEHCKVVISRDGASLRTANELLSVFVADAVSLWVELSPWGVDVRTRYDAALESARDPQTGAAWLPDTDAGMALHDDMNTLVCQAESSLYELGYGVEWEDGYIIYTLPPEGDA